MSFLDKAIAALTPEESDEDRLNARRMAEACAEPGDWLSVILDQHRQIEQGFNHAFNGADAMARQTACRELGFILTGHANAEESVIYPALAIAGEKGHAGMGYEEQAMVKMDMAELERLDPMSNDWAEKLEKIRSEVAHHMFEEEGTWYPELKQKGRDQALLTERFFEEWARYAGGDPTAIMQQPLSS